MEWSTEATGASYVNQSKLEPGTRVKYWGNAAKGRYYGQEFTVQWANVCNCKHQTYSIVNDQGNEVSQALHTSLTVVE